jgi:hypothetical protein
MLCTLMKIFLPIIKELILESRIHSSPSMLISSTENAHNIGRSEKLETETEILKQVFPDLKGKQKISVKWTLADKWT